MLLTVDGLEVEFTPKRVKNINLRVHRPDGRIEVSAPQWMGKAEVEGFIRKKKPWIAKRQQEMAAAAAADRPPVDRKQLAAWRAQVRTATEALVLVWEPVIGVEAKTLAYRNMTSRWGSCNPKTGRVCINIQLANYPPQCLEYVVVHELCHLIERRHNARFWSLVTKYLPDWKQRRALLR